MKTGLTVLEFLNSLKPGLPLSTVPCTVHSAASNGEIKRWCKSNSVILNGRAAQFTEEVDFPIHSLVLFPKGVRKCTLF